MTDKKGALIANKVSHKGYVVPGSLPLKCSKCGELVWVSPSSFLIMVDEPEIVILCVECALKQIRETGGKATVEGLTPAQEEEIEEYHRSEECQR